jgi:lysophospholipase L1-like esterase
MIPGLRFLSPLVVVAAFSLACARPPAQRVVEPPRFAAEIARFDSIDRVRMPAPGGVVFVGSSTIRLWPDLQSDFPGVSVVQRGFGGSRLDEVLSYAPKIVIAYKPRLIVLYAGDNDIAEGRTAEQVYRDYKAFVALVHRSLPEAKIAFVSIKPSESRWNLVGAMRSANEMVRRFTASDPRLEYVDIFNPMLGPDGRPRPELFRPDKLHMTAEGYALWRGILAPVVSSPQ